MKIKLDIMLPPEKLDKDINLHILDKAREVYENTSIKDIGYIIRVQKLIDISKVHIDSMSSFINVEGTYTIDTCYPDVGTVIRECNIHLIMNHGIFVKYYNIDILIPAATLSDYAFDHLNNTFVHKTTKQIVSKDTKIDVIITDFRYHNKEFSCIAKIKI
tara:strand:+ start:104 stop:583 length:480 start_codon:yes stop_codon:yes gene_type:complete